MIPDVEDQHVWYSVAMELLKQGKSSTDVANEANYITNEYRKFKEGKTGGSN